MKSLYFSFEEQDLRKQVGYGKLKIRQHGRGRDNVIAHVRFRLVGRSIDVDFLLFRHNVLNQLRPRIEVVLNLVRHVTIRFGIGENFDGEAG